MQEYDLLHHSIAQQILSLTVSTHFEAILFLFYSHVFRVQGQECKNFNDFLSWHMAMNT